MALPALTKTAGKITVSLAALVLAACEAQDTTVRFGENNRIAVVRNPTMAKPGSRLETLVGTRKQIYFYVTRGASVTSFNSSVDAVSGRKVLMAELSIDEHPLRVFVILLPRPIKMALGPPTPENKELICHEPTMAKILNGAPTELVGRDRGTWITTSSSSHRLYFRTVDADMIVLVDADGLDASRGNDFVLRMGSLTLQ